MAARLRKADQWAGGVTSFSACMPASSCGKDAAFSLHPATKPIAETQVSNAQARAIQRLVNREDSRMNAGCGPGLAKA
jgi:hypothetical protein